MSVVGEKLLNKAIAKHSSILQGEVFTKSISCIFDEILHKNFQKDYDLEKTLETPGSFLPIFRLSIIYMGSTSV